MTIDVDVVVAVCRFPECSASRIRPELIQTPEL